MANKVITIEFAKLPEWAKGYITEGYNYGCACGESHATEKSAWNCRKCLKYLYTDDWCGRNVYFTETPVLS